jgi:hypothetical protein
MAVAVDPKPFDALKKGDSVTLVVEDLRAGERRIALSPLEVKESTSDKPGGRENNDWKAYAKPAKGAEKSSGGGMGSLAEKFAQAMKAKK